MSTCWDVVLYIVCAIISILGRCDILEKKSAKSRDCFATDRWGLYVAEKSCRNRHLSNHQKLACLHVNNPPPFSLFSPFYP